MYYLKSKFFSRIIIAVLLFSLFLSLTACAKKDITNSPQDIYSQKPTATGRTPVTVLVKYAFTINTFEKAVEEKFPDIDIIQVGNYSSNMGIAEYASRLEHNDLTDIVMTWPLDVGEEYWADRLLDLSAMSFTSKYSISMLNNISKKGKLYYLPGPSQVRGIVYNKTMFAENGWEIPSNFDEFIELCQTIEKAGIRSLQLGLKNSEVLDTAFVGYNYTDSYSSPPDLIAIDDFNSGKTSFADHFSPALDTFQKMIDAGVLKPSDLDVSYPKRELMLFNRECAMVEDSVLMARMGYGLTGTTDEFALMPFFSETDGDDCDWARLYMVCYIGLNKNLALPENKDKYNLVMKIMEYISSPEGQASLSGDTGAMFSSLIGVPPPNIAEIEALIPALSQGRYAIFPTLKSSQGALREGLAGMIRGTITKDQVIKLVDIQNSTPPPPIVYKKLGTATKNFSVIETGNFVTDAMREHSGCDIALFMDNGKDGRFNGKGISASMYEGDITSLDLTRILPDLKSNEKGVLCKVSMTGADLLKTLEYSIPINNNQTGWFYYFSGLKMEFNPLAEMGSRISKISMADGKNLETSKVYTIAVMDKTVPDDLLKSYEETNETISDILSQYIEAKGTIEPANDNRFIVIN